MLGHPVLVPVERAGELVSKAWVWVGPPLSASEPRDGSEPMMLPFTPSVNPQALLAVDSIRLFTLVPMVPEELVQSPPVVELAMIVLVRLRVESLFVIPPPELPERVVFSNVNAVPLMLRIPPPLPEDAELLERVLFVTFAEPAALYIPPPPEGAELLEKVLFVTVSVALRLYTPPPVEAELLEILLLVIVRLFRLRIPPPYETKKSQELSQRPCRTVSPLRVKSPGKLIAKIRYVATPALAFA